MYYQNILGMNQGLSGYSGYGYGSGSGSGLLENTGVNMSGTGCGETGGFSRSYSHSQSSCSNNNRNIRNINKILDDNSVQLSHSVSGSMIVGEDANFFASCEHCRNNTNTYNTGKGMNMSKSNITNLNNTNTNIHKNISNKTTISSKQSKNHINIRNPTPENTAHPPKIPHIKSQTNV